METVETLNVRLLLRALLPAALLLSLPVTARAQEQREKEDVVLQGRILRPDGTPAANTPVRVDTKSGFGFFNFFGTLGFATFACFAGTNDLCPIQPGRSWKTVTDANGRYSFTFPDAKYSGEQTDTDYFLSTGIPSRFNPQEAIIGSYELELLTSVHNAPDMRLWDPAVTVKPAEGGYDVDYAPRPGSATHTNVYFGDKAATDVLKGSIIDARAVEDAAFRVSPFASKDERNEGTIYHQRFNGAGVTRRGTLVPLSRGAACTAVRKNGVRVPCAATDGDLSAPSVKAAEETCSYDFEGKPEWFNHEGCVDPVTQITIDMRSPKEVGDIRSRCGCTLTGSKDGVTWVPLAESGRFGTAQSLRYIRIEGSSVGNVPEISAWPADETQRISPITPTTDVEVISPITPKPDETTPVEERADDDLRTPWVEILSTFAVISAAAYWLSRRASMRG